jgi:S-adenosylmethionine:diacylglycerol 3-amino-3-carboxypropyl transferase
MDLVETANSIAETIGKVTTPLTDDQRTFLAAALGPWFEKAGVIRLHTRNSKMSRLSSILEDLLREMRAQGMESLVAAIGDEHTIQVKRTNS